MTRLRTVAATALLLPAALGAPALAGQADPSRTFCQVYLDLVQNGGCTYDQEPSTPAARTTQRVTGHLVSPMGSAVTLVGAAPVTTRSESANGVATWTFRVAPATVGGVFRLTSTSGVNLDVVFYDDGYGVHHRAPRTTGAFYGAGTDGERGVVPNGSAVAVVTLAEGSLADFDYAAAPRAR